MGRGALRGHKGAPSRGAFPAESFRNRGSEKLWGMSFSMCPVGDARQPQAQTGAQPRELQAGGWGWVRLEGEGDLSSIPSRWGAGSSVTPKRGRSQFYQPV